MANERAVGLAAVIDRSVPPGEHCPPIHISELRLAFDFRAIVRREDPVNPRKDGAHCIGDGRTRLPSACPLSAWQEPEMSVSLAASEVVDARRRYRLEGLRHSAHGDASSLNRFRKRAREVCVWF